jgi:hypothetical protein
MLHLSGELEIQKKICQPFTGESILKKSARSRHFGLLSTCFDIPKGRPVCYRRSQVLDSRCSSCAGPDPAVP